MVAHGLDWKKRKGKRRRKGGRTRKEWYWRLHLLNEQSFSEDQEEHDCI